jgi:hypothetical protein
MSALEYRRFPGVAAAACHTPLVDLELLEQTLRDRGEPRFRARQVWAWAASGPPS